MDSSKICCSSSARNILSSHAMFLLCCVYVCIFSISSGISMPAQWKGKETCINFAAANCCMSQTMLRVRNAIFPWMLQRELLAKCCLNIHWMSPTCFDLITCRLNWFNPPFFPFKKKKNISFPMHLLQYWRQCEEIVKMCSNWMKPI